MDKPDLTMEKTVPWRTTHFACDLARMRAAAAHAGDPDTRHALRSGMGNIHPIPDRAPYRRGPVAVAADAGRARRPETGP